MLLTRSALGSAYLILIKVCLQDAKYRHVEPVTVDGGPYTEAMLKRMEEEREAGPRTGAPVNLAL